MSKFKLLRLKSDTFDARYSQLAGNNSMTGTNKFGSTTNYTQFSNAGHQTMVGDATVYDDLQVSISNIRVPTSNAPTERLYAFGIGSGVTMPVLGFGLNNYLYFDVQTSHAMKLESALDVHLHFVLPNTTNISDKFKFQLDVVAAGVNTQWAVPTGSPFSGEHTIAANDNTYHRLLEIADIPGVNTTVSTIYHCKLTRVAATSNEFGSEVYVSYIDCHYIKDSMGSNTEYIK